MVLIQVPESLANDLCRREGCSIVLPTRTGALDVALVVLAAGSNVVSLVVAPEGIKGSLEAIRSWLGHRRPETTAEVGHQSETTVEAHGPAGDVHIVIRDKADIEAALTVIRAVLDPADTPWPEGQC